MPVEAILPLAVFGCLLLLWVLLPPQPGEDDIAARLRRHLLRRSNDS